MATLTGNSVGSSYLGLLKTTDNAVIGATEKNLTDGAGNASTLSVGTTSASFTGTLDLAGATVTGLPGGAPGLIAGSGSGSIESDLGTNANASGSTSIALGSSSVASSTWAIAIGIDAQATNGQGAVAISTSAYSRGTRGIAIGQQSETATGQSDGISIGYLSKSKATNCITIGRSAIVDDAIRVNTVVIGAGAKAAQYSTALGAGTQAVADYCVGIGDSVQAQGSFSFAGGASARASGNGAIALGNDAIGNNAGSISIGQRSEAALTNAVALGYQVTAQWANATTVTQMAFENVANLNYIDQTAAIAGGVPTGGLYHTDGTVKIVY